MQWWYREWWKRMCKGESAEIDTSEISQFSMHSVIIQKDDENNKSLVTDHDEYSKDKWD